MWAPTWTKTMQDTVQMTLPVRRNITYDTTPNVWISKNKKHKAKPQNTVHMTLDMEQNLVSRSQFSKMKRFKQITQQMFLKNSSKKYLTEKTRTKHLMNKNVHKVQLDIYSTMQKFLTAKKTRKFPVAHILTGNQSKTPLTYCTIFPWIAEHALCWRNAEEK